MSEWWTYSLSSFLLFSARTYYRLFELYNADVWPLQIATLAAGLVILFLIVRGTPWSGRVIATILAALWLIVAWAYMLQRYDPINFAARYYAIGFALQAALLIWTGVIRDRLRFDSPRWIGISLIIYALVLHPLIAPISGRPWMQAEIFGLAPDPTVIATLGVLIAATRPNWLLLILPLLWCIISGLTLWTMESPEAPVIATAGLLAIAVLFVRSRNEIRDNQPS
ncbi:MAG TPA: DUF6064 family protein [Xanthobacteraceae bacterium]|nr:DUF6064 family protein [Xanthobacteraceae bacterium]